MGFNRRDLLAGTALFFLGGLSTRAADIRGQLPWTPNSGNPPVPVRPGPWHFFTGAEGRAIQAIADRIIPPDPQTPGGKDAGCAVFIDRQMAGPYGRQDGLYTSPPFLNGTVQQGSQSEAGPAQKCREGLAALDCSDLQRVASIQSTYERTSRWQSANGSVLDYSPSNCDRPAQESQRLLECGAAAKKMRFSSP